MIEWLQTMNAWHWLVLALVLLIIELMAPASFFLWLGIAAAVTGLLLAVIPLSWELQWVCFSVFSVASIIGWRLYRQRNPQTSDQPTLNRRGEQYIGRTFSLDEPIVNGVGKVNVDDSSWRVAGPDLPAGQQVKVTGLNRVVFTVEAAG